jgi:DNA-binding CsgD family transcriptional regulator
MQAGGTMLIARASMKSSHSVLVTPARKGPFTMGAERAAAVVFINDPAVEPPGCIDFLRCLYGLTKAEARLAVVLVGGRGLRHAAEELGISLNTAKTQERIIFEKTNTRRQGELISLLLRTPAFMQACGTGGISTKKGKSGTSHSSTNYLEQGVLTYCKK